MSTLSWWRSWHGAPTDPKWAVVAARSGVKVGIVSAVAWALLDYASQHKVRGTADGFDIETYSVYSGFSEAEISAVIKAMTDKGIIQNGRLAKWEERQPKREDDSKERVQDFREREKKRNVTQCNADTEDETKSNTPVTLSSVSVSLSESDNTDSVLIEEDENKIRKLSDQFSASANMPAHNLERWNNALSEMLEAGVSPSDLSHVIHTMRCPPKGGKKLTIAGPWSCVNPAIAHVSEMRSGSGMGINRDDYEQS
jgi:hypothetical protein